MVGIIGSMDIEIEKLLENMKDIKESMHKSEAKRS